MIKVAYGSVPKDSGTFTFYRNMRLELHKEGIELMCVSLGKFQARLWDNKFEDEGCILLAQDIFSIKKQAQIFVDWCIKERVNVVVGINSEAILASIPHLPSHIKVISRCASGVDHGYRITLSGAERLSAVIALTPKLKYDLINNYGARADIIHLIPNGIDPSIFEDAKMKRRGTKEILRLGFLGRLEHYAKGVMHLPLITSVLDEFDIKYNLKIAGKGRKRANLEYSFQDQIINGTVELVGQLSPSDIPRFLSEIDILLFPSHFEGCPNVLIEGMHAGCIPIAWRITGTTDFIINNHETGFVCDLGDYNQIGKFIKDLEKDRDLLQQISLNASRDSRNRFTPKIAARKYAQVIKSIMDSKHLEVDVKSWNTFKPEPNFKSKKFWWIPRQIKDRVKFYLNY